jgi:hypothetical protein
LMYSMLANALAPVIASFFDLELKLVFTGVVSLLCVHYCERGVRVHLYQELPLIMYQVHARETNNINCGSQLPC